MSTCIDNEGHAAALREFGLTEWHQAPGPTDWGSRNHLRLAGDATSRLVQLLHSAGLALVPRLVDGG